MLTLNAASFQTSTCVQHLQHHDKHNPSSFMVQERKELRIVPLVHELLTPSNTVQTYTSISVTADIIEGWIFHQNLHANFFFFFPFCGYVSSCNTAVHSCGIHSPSQLQQAVSLYTLPISYNGTPHMNITQSSSIYLHSLTFLFL